MCLDPDEIRAALGYHQDSSPCHAEQQGVKLTPVIPLGSLGPIYHPSRGRDTAC